MAVRTRHGSSEQRDSRRVRGAKLLVGWPSANGKIVVCDREVHCRVAGRVHGRDQFDAYGAAVRNSKPEGVRGAAGSTLSQ